MSASNISQDRAESHLSFKKKFCSLRFFENLSFFDLLKITTSTPIDIGLF